MEGTGAGVPSNISDGLNVGGGQHSARLFGQLFSMGEPNGFASIPYQVVQQVSGDDGFAATRRQLHHYARLVGSKSTLGSPHQFALINA